MTLRFIGADGSMGLKHGETYWVDITTPFTFSGPYLRVRIYLGGNNVVDCPYSSPQSFAKNWEAV